MQMKGRKVSVIRRVILVLLVFVLLIVGGSAAYFYSKLSKVKAVKISKTNTDLGITKDTQKNLEKYQDDIVNIAFFGLDRRTQGEAARSDSIEILTIDNKHKKIKLSSVMRDTYVNVEGHGMTKITHAYAYGGPQLAVKTLNENFKLNIKDFVAVDFFQLENIIDDLGGITLNIKPEEIQYMNSYMQEVAKLEKSTVPTITQAGVQHINGKQAVAYSRIRYTAGGDFERTERQRTVLTALLNKIKSDGPTKLPDSLNKLLPYVQTSMNTVDILKTGNNVFSAGISNLEQERFPLDGYCKGVTINQVWYLQTDLNVTSDQMTKYIFDDVKPVPGTPLF